MKLQDELMRTQSRRIAFGMGASAILAAVGSTVATILFKAG